jgi:hypothetical protein
VQRLLERRNAHVPGDGGSLRGIRHRSALGQAARFVSVSGLQTPLSAATWIASLP